MNSIAYKVNINEKAFNWWQSLDIEPLFISLLNMRFGKYGLSMLFFKKEYWSLSINEIIYMYEYLHKNNFKIKVNAA